MDFDFRRYKHIYAADFETSTEAWNCEARVWLWDICDKDYKHRTGTSINYFMNYIIRTSYKCLYFFRNLAYDGSYIITWLFNNGYKHVNKKSDEMLPFEFHTVISDMGLHYAYEIVGRMGQHVTIMDSLKTVNMSIHDSAIMYDLPIKKGEIDYDKFREIGYKPTDEEIDYIHNDTEIDMRTIQKNIEMGGVKFTQAGNARSEFIKGIGKKNYDINFPFLQQIEETNIRKAYRGGYVYCNPKYQNKVIYNMMALDKNSMYPAQMLHEYMPHGFPMWYSGKYDDKYSGKYPIYIQHIKVSFELKPNAVPTIARRNGFLSSDNLYLNSSNGLMFDLWLANPDLELLYMCYDIIEIEYIEGYMFKAVKGIEITPNEAKNMDKFEIIDEDGKGSLFYDYIHKWRLGKETHTGAARSYDKRMQNALYGTFGTNPKRDSKEPYLENGVLRFSLIEGEYSKTKSYIPIAVFVTAWARYNLIKYILKNIDKFVYCDTDSLYVLDDINLNNIPIHSTLYDYFKIEHYIYKFKCVGAKRYIYWGWEPKTPTVWNKYVTCCGADDNIKKQMDFDNFNLGQEFQGKKQVKSAIGGKVIGITTYRLGKIKKEG